MFCVEYLAVRWMVDIDALFFRFLANKVSTCFEKVSDHSQYLPPTSVNGGESSGRALRSQHQASICQMGTGDLHTGILLGEC